MKILRWRATPIHSSLKIWFEMIIPVKIAVRQDKTNRMPARVCNMRSLPHLPRRKLANQRRLRSKCQTTTANKISPITSCRTCGKKWKPITERISTSSPISSRNLFIATLSSIPQAKHRCPLGKSAYGRRPPNQTVFPYLRQIPPRRSIP